jgi:predicted  nucleic acid-binding Zn-ribbon protein
MYTEQRTYALEAAVGQLDRRTSDLERLTTRLANVERLTEAAADVTALIALISDPKAAKARLEALQKATQEVEAGQAKLAADRDAHEREVAETKATLANRWALLMERERAAPPPAPRPEPADDPFPFDPNLRPGSRGPTGLARARHHG